MSSFITKNIDDITSRINLTYINCVLLCRITAIDDFILQHVFSQVAPHDKIYMWCLLLQGLNDMDYIDLR